MSSNRYVHNSQHILALDGLDQRGVYRNELNGVLEQSLRRQLISCYIIESTLSTFAALWHGVSDLSQQDLLDYYDVNFKEHLLTNMQFLESFSEKQRAPIARFLNTLKCFTYRLHTYSHEDLGRSIVAALVCGMLLVQTRSKIDENLFQPESRNVNRSFLQDCLEKAKLKLPGMDLPQTASSRQEVEKYVLTLLTSEKGEKLKGVSDGFNFGQ
jgi:hypothetical protein